MRRRPEIYNSQVELVEELERKGDIKVIRPVSPKGIGRLEKDTSKLMELYMQGYESAMSRMEEIREYMMR